MAELYPGMSCTQIGKLLGVSHQTVLQDLRALGIPRLKPGARKKHVAIGPRECARCGEEFTPRDDKVDAQFCSRRCSDLGRRTTRSSGMMTRSERIERSATLYLSGMSYEEIAKRHGVTAMTARADVAAAGVQSRRACRRPMHTQGEWRNCRHCGLGFWTYASQLHEFCGQDCWAQYRWKHGIALEPLIGHLTTVGRFPPLARQRWRGRWNGHKGAAAGAEGGREGGRPIQSTTEQVKEVWRLRKEGLNLSQIAERVYGDRRLYKRVRRIVGDQQVA